MQQAYKTFYQNSVEGIIVSNEIGIIELINPNLLQMFGYKEHELIGQPIEILGPCFFKKDQDYKDKNTHQIVEGKKKRYGKILIGQRKDQSQFPIVIEFNYCYMREELKSIATVIDITYRFKSQYDSEELNTKLDNIVKIRTKEIEEQKNQAIIQQTIKKDRPQEQNK